MKLLLFLLHFLLFPIIAFSQASIGFTALDGMNPPSNIFYGFHAVTANIVHSNPKSILTHVGSMNTLVGFHAGIGIDSGSYNFIVGEDSIAVNLAPYSSDVWYIQPDAKHFIKYPDCLKCLLLVYPHVYYSLPKDQKQKNDIIEKGRKCLFSAFNLKID